MQYTSTFSFQDIDTTKYADGLVPVIIQDNYSHNVLMLGFMNEEAFNNTLKTGYVTFFSRTRQKLWQKGEESGNVLNLVSMHLDCDNDTILALVNPVGPTCHKGTTTCWGTKFDNFGFIGKLYQTISNKLQKGFDSASYTSRLLTGDIKKLTDKIHEECGETIVEAERFRKNGFIYEVCDLIYHLIVLLVRMGVTPEDINEELEKRSHQNKNKGVKSSDNTLTNDENHQKAEIVPAIDLLDGKVVRLFQGDYDKVTYYELTLEETLKIYSEMGFKWVHVVDLTAAHYTNSYELENYLNSDKRNSIEECLKDANRRYGINIEFCGGIRNISDSYLIDNEIVQRICIGTEAFIEQGFFNNMCEICHSENVSLGLDLKNDKICIHGWNDKVDMSWQDFILQHRDVCKHIICTDIMKDGTRQGCSFDLYKRIIEFLRENNIDCELIASGGVSKNDLEELHRIGVNKAIIGKELLDNL